MSSIVQEILKKLVFPVDYPSQRSLSSKAELLIKVVAVLAFVYGLYSQSIKNLLVVYGAGLVVVALVVVPPYPSYNKQKLSFVVPKQVAVDIVG